MKRSEMIQFITSLLDIGKDQSYEDQAENLLCQLEEKGMLPPVLDKITKMKNYDYFDLRYSEALKSHIWENEDE